MPIRPAALADIPRLTAIRAAVRENRLSDPTSVTPASYDLYISRGHLWVAEDAGEILGFAALDAEAASVWALFVDPEAEGRGAGRLLLDRVVAEARALRLPALSLTTEQGSRAERLYRAAGWIVVDGDGKALLKMELRLRVATRPPGSLPSPQPL